MADLNRNRGSSVNDAWWRGVVVDVQDPNQSGAVRVRIFGHTDDILNIPQSTLPWIKTIQPTTSAAFGRMGTAPVGIVVGTTVIGIWQDVDMQIPLIIGTLGKDGDVTSGTSSSGAPNIDTSVGSIPPASQGSPNNPISKLKPPASPSVLSPLSPAETAFRQASGEIESNQTSFDAATQKIAALNGVSSSSLSLFSTSLSSGVVITQAVETGMKNAKIATIGFASKTNTGDILDIITSVDPLHQINSLPCIHMSFLSLKNLLSIAAGIAGQIAAGLKALMISAIQNAILMLAQKLGVFKVLSMINSAANEIKEVANLINALNIHVCGMNLFNQKAFNVINGVIAETLSGLNTIVGAISSSPSMIVGAASNIFDNLVTAPLASVATSSTPVPPTVSLSPPGTYIQQYSTTDAFPGFLTFIDPSGVGSPVYTPRNGEPNYVSAAQHTFFNAQNNMIQGLESSLLNNTLTSSGLTSVFGAVTSATQAFAATKALGEGFSAVTAVASAAVAIISMAITIPTVVAPLPSLLPSSPLINIAMTKFAIHRMVLNNMATQSRIGVGAFS